MSVSWGKLQNEILDIIKGRTANNEDEFADKLANAYHNAVILNAADLVLANKIISVKKNALVSALKSAFKLAKGTNNEANASNIMRSFINIGIVGYWLGGQLSTTNPPPPAVTVVTNLVVFPGVPPDVKVSNTTNPEDFAREFTAKVRAHALTVKVVTSGVTANGAPVVLSINGLN